MKTFLERVTVVLLVALAGGFCDSNSPSSYQNQVSGGFASGFFHSETTNSYMEEELEESEEDDSYLKAPIEDDLSEFADGSTHYFYPTPSSMSIENDNMVDGIDEKYQKQSVLLKASAPRNLGFTYDAHNLNGPSRWGGSCNVGNSQSPVNLVRSQVAVQSRPLVIDGFSKVPQSIRFANNGHAAEIRFRYRDGVPVRLIGGPLKVAYNLDNIHWHWGSQDNEGSEHTLNSRRFSAEAHLVLWNSRYGSFDNAATKPQGLAVLAFFYELDNSDGATDNPFIRFLSRVKRSESSYIETAQLFSLGHVIKQANVRFLSYKGSLTTPGCSENVLWMVSTKPLKISSRELAQFRRLRDERGRLLRRNVRPLQRLNNRRITAY